MCDHQAMHRRWAAVQWLRGLPARLQRRTELFKWWAICERWMRRWIGEQLYHNLWFTSEWERNVAVWVVLQVHSGFVLPGTLFIMRISHWLHPSCRYPATFFRTHRHGHHCLSIINLQFLTFLFILVHPFSFSHFHSHVLSYSHPFWSSFSLTPFLLSHPLPTFSPFRLSPTR